MAVDTSYFDLLVKNGQLDDKTLYGDTGKKFLCEIIKNGDKQELEDYLSKYNAELLQYKNDKFDILAYTIKNNTPKELIEFIIEKTPYTVLNYTIKEENNLCGTPLFLALAHNYFSIADLLIEKGANINYSLNCILDTIKEEDIASAKNSFKYFDVIVSRDCFTHDYVRVIYSDVIQYLCESETLNTENLEYIINHHFNINSIRPGIIKQLERNNKPESAKLISNLINK